MGESSVSCAFSGLTLHGEKAVFIPLHNLRFQNKLMGSRLMSHGYQSCALFAPLTLPYWLEVDDYGSFDEIEKDENTSIVEAWSDLSVEELTNACILGEEMTIGEKQFVGAGCFIHPQVYERFSKPVTGGRYAGSIWQGTFAGKVHLETIGCELASTLGANERYRFVYKHPVIKGVGFHSDGMFSRIITDTGKRIQEYGLIGMQSALRRAGLVLFPMEDVKKAQQTSELQAIYRDECLELEQGKGGRRLIQFRETNNGDADLCDLYLSAFTQGLLLDRLEQLTHLLAAFNHANRLLMPTIASSQVPDHATVSVITGVIDRIAQERIRKQGRDRFGNSIWKRQDS